MVNDDNHKQAEATKSFRSAFPICRIHFQCEQQVLLYISSHLIKLCKHPNYITCVYLYKTKGPAVWVLFSLPSSVSSVKSWGKERTEIIYYTYIIAAENVQQEVL